MSTAVWEAESRFAAGAPQLTPAEVQQFHQQGYLIVRKLADEAALQSMLAITLEHLAREIEPVEFEAELHYPGAPSSLAAEGGRTIRRLKQAHARGVVFTSWVSSPAVTGPLTLLLGGPPIMPLAHHNCIMTKQPRYSSDTGWHQDIRYWSYQRPELISVWLALGPENTENGCLRVIPGSHRMEFDRSRFDEAVFFRPDLPENQELIRTSVPVLLDAGDVLFFHCRTLHAASRNRAELPKFSVVFTFRAADNLPLPGTRSAALPELTFPGISPRP